MSSQARVSRQIIIQPTGEKPRKDRPMVHFKDRGELRKSVAAAARSVWPGGVRIDVEVRGHWSACTGRIFVDSRDAASFTPVIPRTAPETEAFDFGGEAS
ncbi:hypothetical protein [Arthrobacter sp.]|uniref:hypothetical protein n=1 Tax=Arthrobacter sp. TaxID=1667 RepID=UPI003A8EA6CC